MNTEASTVTGKENRTKTIGPVDIIIPTYNNWDMLASCVSSILAARLAYPVRILIVNNGHPDSLSMLSPHPSVEVIESGGKNLGWEGGLKEGLKRSTSEFVCFMNDDAFIPPSSMRWLSNLVSFFRFPEIGAVGPTSNVVMGTQNIWKQIAFPYVEVSYLIGFCVLLRRKALDEVGGVDDTLPGGDDLDVSIRLRSAGYKLICARDVFVYHHGFSTGNRLHGDAGKKNGWNSKEMSDRTNTAIIKKHGFRKWFECIMGLEYKSIQNYEDKEGDFIRPLVVGEKVLDLGCANNKTIPSSVGVDIVKKGEAIQNLNVRSEADVTADVTKALPFDEGSQDTIIARHILEHCLDPIDALENWSRYLREGGRLIVAVPDEEAQASISLNPEHVHAFIAEFLGKCAASVGFLVVSLNRIEPGVIVGVFEKRGKQK